MSDAATVRPHLRALVRQPPGRLLARPGRPVRRGPGRPRPAGCPDDPRRQRRVRASRTGCCTTSRRASSSSTALVRCRPASGTGCSTWSLPTGSSPPTAPRSSRRTSASTADGIDEVVQAHEKFFNATKRVQSLKALLEPGRRRRQSCEPRSVPSCSARRSTACWRSPARC